jgi:hypothetical protein
MTVPRLHSDKLFLQETQLNSWLKALFYIKNKANFNLEILLLQRNIRIGLIEEVLMALTSVWEVFHSRCGYVSIGGLYRGNWHGGLDHASIERVPRGMEDFCFLGRKFWRTEVIRLLVTVSRYSTQKGFNHYRRRK